MFIVINGMLLDRLLGLFLMSAIWSAPCQCSKSKIFLELISLRNCSNTEGYSCHVTNVVPVRPSIDENYFRADFIVTEPLTNLMPVKMELYKCPDRTGINCEYMVRANFPDGCKLFSKKNEFWSPMFKSVTPKWACPLAKGTYSFASIKPDTKKVMDVLSGMPFATNYHWMLKTEYYNRKKLWACFEIVSKPTSIRV